MTSHPLYSPATSALLLAMTALQLPEGVDADVAFENALGAWRAHVDKRGNDTWEYEDLKALVAQLTHR